MPGVIAGTKITTPISPMWPQGSWKVVWLRSSASYLNSVAPLRRGVDDRDAQRRAGLGDLSLVPVDVGRGGQGPSASALGRGGLTQSGDRRGSAFGMDPVCVRGGGARWPFVLNGRTIRTPAASSTSGGPRESRCAKEPTERPRAKSCHRQGERRFRGGRDRPAGEQVTRSAGPGMYPCPRARSGRLFSVAGGRAAYLPPKPMRGSLDASLT